MRIRAVSAGTPSDGTWRFRYRLIRSFFVQTKHWKDYDPFLAQKEATFQKSSKAIYRAWIVSVEARLIDV